MSALGILLTLLPLDPAVGQSDGDHPTGWRATGFLLGTAIKPALAAGSVAPSAGSRDHTFDAARQRYAQALAASPGLTGKQTEAALWLGRPPGKQLLLDPVIGTLQASFATPDETGLAKLSGELETARRELAAHPGDPASAARLDQKQRVLAAAMATMLAGPVEGWALIGLDASGDGRVNGHDVEFLKQGRPPAGSAGQQASAAPATRIAPDN